MLLAAILHWLMGLGAAALALLALWPRSGLVARWRAARQLARRSRREDALKHLLHGEANRRSPALDSLAGVLRITTAKAAAVLADLEKRGLVSYADGGPKLTSEGRELALHVVRAHRLWESYLADQTGVAEADWHHQAERKEHQLTPQQAEELAARLGNPMRDPHGDLIPPPGGELAAEPGQTLNAAALNHPLMITHLEDEPEAVYAQLAALGLQPGMLVTVAEKNPQRVRFRTDHREHVLAPVLAENVFVSPLPETASAALPEAACLASLQPGQRARVAGLAPACRGAERRRLLDLGFVPGTEVAVELVSPAGDPVAYRVRGTVIALRREQANLIRILPQEALAA